MVMGVFPDARMIVVLGLAGGIVFLVLAFLTGMISSFAGEFSAIAVTVTLLLILGFTVKSSSIDDLKVIPLLALLAGISVFAALFMLFLPDFNIVLPTNDVFGTIQGFLFVATSLVVGQVAVRRIGLG